MRKIKFSNILTKGNETQNQSTSKSKRKIFKAFGFGSLAVMMAVAGTFAFAPLGASPSVANANEIEMTTASGLGLDPKNDPVVYTTESGLEIRMSNASAYTGTVNTTSTTGKTFTQDLRNLYYITMGKYSGTIYTGENASTSSYISVNSVPVNWIIIGVGSHSSSFIQSVSNYLFSLWKSNSYLFQDGDYYFKNTYDATTPAGKAIHDTVSAKTYIMGQVKIAIPVHTEIPKNHMLVISEKLLGKMYFNSSGSVNYSVASNADTDIIYGNQYYGERYRYIGSTATTAANGQSWNTSSNSGGSLYNYINNLFSKNSSGTILKNGLGFTQAEANLIVPQQLYTYYTNGASYPLAETPSTDGGTYYTMFPLAYRAAKSTTKQNFCLEDYLPNASKRVAALIGTNQTHQWWTRSGAAHQNCADVYAVSCSGDMNGTTGVNASHGVRPAMVMKMQ